MEATLARPRRWARFIFTYRRMLVVFAHLLLWTTSLVGAFALRFDFNGPWVASYLSLRWLFILLGARLATYSFFGAFHGLWRYTGARDLQTLLKATTLSSLIFATVLAFIGSDGFPRSIYIIDWLGTIILAGGLRFTSRAMQEFVAQVGAVNACERVLIVGAGNAGEMLLREIQKNHSGRYLAVGFVDDNPDKLHASIHGVRVLGTLAEVPRLVKQHHIHEMIIAIPVARGRLMRRIVAACQPAGVPIRTIPSQDYFMGAAMGLQELRDVAIEDLLGRPPVALDEAALSQFLRGQVVLVTGAGGSIGAELCRQVCRFGPARLLMLDQAEHPLFCMEQELARSAAHIDWTSYVGNVCDARRMAQIFREERPSVVLHAAAHKHVPLMERNPAEAIKNNIMGTQCLADLADAQGVAHFVMISTDKAVNPTSVMGASKRVAEMYVQALARRSRTRFNIVRFGNVLGSQGSVIPIFKEQIARGGPVTITHPDMRRYFMTIPEACQLVLQAGAMGQGGELFVLDMGEPVKILDLARDLIALSGLVPDEDIEIKYIGLRSGEKLFEELSLASEKAGKTLHPKIFIGRVMAPPLALLTAALDHLNRLAQEHAPHELLRQALSKVVPEYHPPKPAHPLAEDAAETAYRPRIAPGYLSAVSD